MAQRTKTVLLLLTIFQLFVVVNTYPQANMEFPLGPSIKDPLIRPKQKISYVYLFELWQSVDTFPYYEKVISIGDTLYVGKHYKEALTWYRKGIFYYIYFKKSLASALYGKIANCYIESGEEENAIQNNIKALEYIGYGKEPELTGAKLHTNIAAILIKIEDYDKALFYLDKALPVFGSKHDSLDAAIALANKARLYTNTEKKPKAIIYYVQALTLVEGLLSGYRDNLMALTVKTQIVTNIIGLYIDRNKTDSALIYLDKLRKDPFLYSLSNQTTIRYFYGNIYALKKEYKASAFYLEQCLQIAQKEQSQDIILATHRALTNMYRSQGDYKKAWEHAAQYSNMLRQQYLETNKNINKINSLESKYNVALKDNELMQKQLFISQQAKNISRKNLVIVIIAIGALALVLLSLVFLRSYRRKQRLLLKEQEVEQLKAMMRGEENERTRLARELHDGIGGMLAAIKMNVGSIKTEYPETAHINKLDHIARMLQDTSIEVRKTAHNLMPEVLNRHSLEEALHNYCQQVNAAGKLQIDLYLPAIMDQLEKPVELMLYRMAQELVQNVIKHAEASLAEIQLMQYEDKLVLTVEDNGLGFAAGTYQEGYGLENLRHRVEALKGSLAITSIEGKSTTVYIEFDLEKLRELRVGG